MTEQTYTAEQYEGMANTCEGVYAGDHPGDMKEAARMLRQAAQMMQNNAEAKQQWDEVAALLGADGDNVDGVIAAAKAAQMMRERDRDIWGEIGIGVDVTSDGTHVCVRHVDTIVYSKFHPAPQMMREREPVKVTDEAANAAFEIYADHIGGPTESMRAALNSFAASLSTGKAVPDALDSRVVAAFQAVANWAGPNLTAAINQALAAAPEVTK